MEISCASCSPIDAYDREMLAWHAVTGAGANDSIMRDLMLEAVELRFDTIQTLYAVEWLSDNGSAFTARETPTSLRCGSMPHFAHCGKIGSSKFGMTTRTLQSG
jgi:transposase InsO family protein